MSVLFLDRNAATWSKNWDSLVPNPQVETISDAVLVGVETATLERNGQPVLLVVSHANQEKDWERLQLAIKTALEQGKRPPFAMRVAEKSVGRFSLDTWCYESSIGLKNHTDLSTRRSKFEALLSALQTVRNAPQIDPGELVASWQIWTDRPAASLPASPAKGSSAEPELSQFSQILVGLAIIGPLWLDETKLGGASTLSAPDWWWKSLGFEPGRRAGAFFSTLATMLLSAETVLSVRGEFATAGDCRAVFDFCEHAKNGTLGEPAVTAMIEALERSLPKIAGAPPPLAPNASP